MLQKLKLVTAETERSVDADMNMKYYLDTVRWEEKARGSSDPDSEHMLQGGHIICHVLYNWMKALEALSSKRKQMAIDAANKVAGSPGE